MTKPNKDGTSAAAMLDQMWLGVVVHIQNPALGKLRQDSHKLKVRVHSKYQTIFRTAKTFLFQKKNKQTKNKPNKTRCSGAHL